MKSTSADLIALLASDQFVMADMLTITLQSGTIARYTSWDQDLTVGGNSYLSGDVKFARDRVALKVGVEVDTMALTLWADATNTIASVPVLQLVRSGGMDGARVKVDRLFMPSASITANVSAGTASVFSGRVTDVQVSRTEARLNVASDLTLLNIMMPRNMYQPGCIHTLFDDDMLALGKTAVGCTLDKTSYAETLAVAAYPVSTAAVIYPAVATKPDAYYDLGYVVFTSGANNGLKRTVKSYARGIFTLSNPLPNVPAAADGFTAYPGCDKMQATCTTKFSNVVHFRGFPFIPTPENGI